MVHDFNSRIWEAEAKDWELKTFYSEFKASQSYQMITQNKVKSGSGAMVQKFIELLPIIPAPGEPLFWLLWILYIMCTY